MPHPETPSIPLSLPEANVPITRVTPREEAELRIYSRLRHAIIRGMQAVAAQGRPRAAKEVFDEEFAICGHMIAEMAAAPLSADDLQIIRVGAWADGISAF